jgi:NAD(P)H-quinone oxidoreductase subunit M
MLVDITDLKSTNNLTLFEIANFLFDNNLAIHYPLSTIHYPQMLLKSTTRHIHIYTAEVKKNELIPSEQVLTLDVDPDNELIWREDTLRKVYGQFDDLVESYSGADLTEYNLRRIGSDLEHFVRSLLQNGEIGYNLDSRVLNYSMGLPQVVSKTTD